ncbi:MAG: hypothetical protein CMP91_00745 [Gammaproteobacteria bacterium]|nr:hypothetical protein [Gammaproteobacteria bacterium]MAY01738.1 hypothetical protein [Gammaproteobacteria bacterium]
MPLSAAEFSDDWIAVVRDTPYADSQGVASNLTTIRSWVLFSESYCANPQRHILFDHRGRFLGYIENAATPADTISLLNNTRESMHAENRVSFWSPGAIAEAGFPLALACDQPFFDLDESIARVIGSREEYLLWGTWDNITVGSEDEQVSLISLIRTVYQQRRQQNRFTFSDRVIPGLLGKVIIESGAVPEALSSQNARGIMQLSPEVLEDCEIPDAFRLHRIAQVDCALRLMEQNHRNLQPPFNQLFAHLPETKRERLYNLLLSQAYQIGIGRVTELLNGEILGQAASYFSANHARFSAEDILVGIIFHNLGRRDIGLRTLYYVTDIRLAQNALCDTTVMQEDPWCIL